MVMVVFQDDDLALARCDSLDLDDELHNRCVRLYDAIPHGECDGDNR